MPGTFYILSFILRMAGFGVNTLSDYGRVGVFFLFVINKYMIGSVFLTCSLHWNVREQQRKRGYFLSMLNSGGGNTYRLGLHTM